MTSAYHTCLRAMAFAATILLLAASAGATSPGKGATGHRVPASPMSRVMGPAGPTPLNPAGPTPLNPAGPTPLNPTGLSIAPRTGVALGRSRGVHVGIVGAGSSLGVPIGQSFFCEVHNRGYASESLFFEHLAVVDGVMTEEALPYLVDGGGVWIFPAE